MQQQPPRPAAGFQPMPPPRGFPPQANGFHPQQQGGFQPRGSFQAPPQQVPQQQQAPRLMLPPRGFQPPPRGFQPSTPAQQQNGGIFYGTTGNAPPRQQQMLHHPPGFTPTQAHKTQPPPSGASRGITAMNIDFEHQCPPQYCKFTFEKFPESEQVRARAGNLPLAAVFRPFCDFEDAPPIPPVLFSASTSVIRCRRCRGYVSPFSVFIDNGRRWQCALCFNVNEVETEYYCELNPETGKRLDYMQRPELHSGVIDIIAPEEYTLRPPPPPVFLFCIDVSPHAIRNGMLAVASQAIKRSLANLPGIPRTQVGFITFDTEIHFYDLSSGSTVRMLVVSELNAMFHPTSTDNLLVEVQEHHDFIAQFLDQLPGMHNATGVDTGSSALGPAIEAAFDIMAPMGGKMIVFQTQLPMMIEGSAPEALHHGGLPKPGRGFEGKTLGAPNEHELLQPMHNWYASKADVFNRQHISVDWYCAPPHTVHYVDVATTAELCHLTAGKLRFYPKFHAFRDGERMTRDIERSLTTVCCTEAVMRVRASTGVKVNRFFGSFIMRARDLIALPQSDPDGVYGFEFQFENPEAILPGRYVTFQSAVLYTTMDGERRIHVTNTAVPISSNPQEVLNGMRPEVVMSILYKRAAEEARETSVGLEQARNQLKLSFWKMQEAGLNPALTDLLARNIVGCIKSPALRGGTDVGYDERYFLLRLVGRASIDRLGVMMRPKLVQLGGGEDLALSRQSLNQDGVYVLDNGLHFMLWLGSRVPSAVLMALVGVDHLSKVDSTVKLLAPGGGGGEHPFKTHLYALIAASRRAHPEDFAPVLLVREGDSLMEARMFWGLVNDPQSFRGGEITVEDLVSRGRAPRQAGGGGGVMPQQMPPRQPPAQIPRVGGPPQQQLVGPRGPPASPGMPAARGPPNMMNGPPPRAGGPPRMAGPPSSPGQPRAASPMGPGGGGPRPPMMQQQPLRAASPGGPRLPMQQPRAASPGGPRPPMQQPRAASPIGPGGGPRPPMQQQQQQPLGAPRPAMQQPQMSGAPRPPMQNGPHGPPPMQQTPRGPPPSMQQTPRGPPPSTQQTPRGPPPSTQQTPRGPPPSMQAPRGPPPPMQAPRGPSPPMQAPRGLPPPMQASRGPPPPM